MEQLAVGLQFDYKWQHEGRFHGDESVLHLYCGEVTQLCICQKS